MLYLALRCEPAPAYAAPLITKEGAMRKLTGRDEKNQPVKTADLSRATVRPGSATATQNSNMKRRPAIRR
jgi:hypothetical protein